jgi:phosphatidylglycerophosphate synthase
VRLPYQRLPTRKRGTAPFPTEKGPYPFFSALATEIIGLSAVLCLALVARTILPLTLWYPVKAVGLFSVVMLVTLSRVRAHHPFAQFGPANQLTTARAVLVVLVAGLIGENGLPQVAATAAALGLAATILDGLDGWLARQAGMASAFGARFDVEVDALLIQALAVLAWRYGKAGPWVLLSGLLRYGFVAAGWLLPWMHRPLTPTLRGRIICTVQIVALVLAVVPAVTTPVSTVIAALGLAALCYSFLVDTLRLWRDVA